MMFLVLFLALCVSSTSAVYITPETKNLSANDTYDYVIVGGGIGGLVTATRLSENSSVSVLLIEAGELDDQADDVTVPGTIGHSSSQRYNWNLTTVRQQYLDNENRTLAQGRVVGGSTILNGLCWTRGSKAKFDAWEALGNDGWGWDDMEPYFRKAEKPTTTVHPGLQVSALEGQSDLQYGYHGLVEVGYPQFFYNQSINFLNGMEELGIPFNDRPNSGDPTGYSVIPSSMTLEKQSREDPRVAYLDPVISRPNLHVLTGHTVTRILHDNSTTHRNSSDPSGDSRVVITGVEFATDSTAERHDVACRKEVILAAGAIFSPVLLHISGIGPKSVLEGLGIDVVLDLPGVGRNLQDHPMVQPVYRYSAPDVFTSEDIVGSKRDEVRAEYFANRTGPWTAPSVNLVAFPSLRSITDDWAQLLRGAGSTADHLPAFYDATLYAGYAAQQDQLLALLNRTDSPAYELISTSWGRLAVGALQPFSRGYVSARSACVFGNAPPTVDPRYCSHGFDCEVLLLGLEANARLVRTAAMAALAPVPDPGFGPEDVGDRAALDRATRRMLRTGFHPAGTAAMMPLGKGGVVDASLRVHGTRNLRVVDAGVLPLVPDGHIQAAIYAVAEKAADIIKRESSALPDVKAPSRRHKGPS